MELLFDTFTAPTNTPLTLHAPEVGGAWKVNERYGTWGGTPRIIGNRLKAPGSESTSGVIAFNQGGGLLTGETNWALTMVFAFVTDPNYAGYASLRLCTHAENEEDGPSGGDFLVEIDPNTIYTPGATNYSKTIVFDTEYTIRLEFTAPTLKVFLDNVLIKTSTGPYDQDSVPAPQGRLGIWITNLGGADAVAVNSIDYGEGAAPPALFWTDKIATQEIL